jgi:hypothetical protein
MLPLHTRKKYIFQIYALITWVLLVDLKCSKRILGIRNFKSQEAEITTNNLFGNCLSDSEQVGRQGSLMQPLLRLGQWQRARREGAPEQLFDRKQNSKKHL